MTLYSNIMANFDLVKMLETDTLQGDLRCVERELLHCLPSNESPLYVPLSRIFQAGSKRLRPALLLHIATEPDAGLAKNTLFAATAIELLHLGSLIHDDTIDAATSRWNQSTINQQEGPNLAIIAGDYVFARAASKAANVCLPVAALAAEALERLCEGQSLEMAAQHDIRRSQAMYLEAIRGKTAALFGAACAMGGYLAGFSADRTQALSAYGEAFGMAFQLLDDVLDFVSSDVLSGKAVGTDIRQGVYTLPLILGLAGPAAAELTRLLKRPKLQSARITSLLMRQGHLQQALEAAYTQCRLAESALYDFVEPRYASLRSLPVAYMTWSLNNLVAEPYATILKPL